MTSLREKTRTAAAVLATIPSWRWRHLADWWTTWRTSSLARLERPLPWLSWPCIDWLHAYLRPGMRVFEYGGGGSTLLFLAHDCEVTTVEGHLDWAEAIRQAAGLSASKLALRHLDTSDDTPAGRRYYAESALAGAPWDVILVDGAFRRECTMTARDCIAPGGIIIVDNTDLPEYADVRAHKVLAGFQRRTFRGLGFARLLPTTTEVFTASTVSDLRCGPRRSSAR